MKSRETLVRLNKWKVDEVRRRLVDLERMREDFIQRSADIDAKIAEEKRRSSSSEMGIYAFPYFARSMKDRQDNLMKSMAGIEEQIEATKAELQDAYRELKRYEIIEDRAEAQEKAEEERVAQAELDEIGLRLHRSQKTGTSEPAEN